MYLIGMICLRRTAQQKGSLSWRKGTRYFDPYNRWFKKKKDHPILLNKEVGFAQQKPLFFTSMEHPVFLLKPAISLANRSFSVSLRAWPAISYFDCSMKWFFPTAPWKYRIGWDAGSSPAGHECSQKCPFLLPESAPQIGTFLLSSFRSFFNVILTIGSAKAPFDKSESKCV